MITHGSKILVTNSTRGIWGFTWVRSFWCIMSLNVRELEETELWFWRCYMYIYINEWCNGPPRGLEYRDLGKRGRGWAWHEKDPYHWARSSCSMYVHYYFFLLAAQCRWSFGRRWNINISNFLSQYHLPQIGSIGMFGFILCILCLVTVWY